jgi:hypothetical protein
MVDAWEVAVADEAQLRDDLAEECRPGASDFAVIERMVRAALIGSLVGDRGDDSGGIVIPIRARSSR